jgi:hypothetical protein
MELCTTITAIGISLASLHLPHTGQQQFNPGVTLECDNVRSGMYYNSNRKLTAFLGYSYPIYEANNLRVGLFAALASGYKYPVVGGLEFRVGKHANIYLAPPVGKQVGSVLSSTRGNYSPTTFGLVLRFPL